MTISDLIELCGSDEPYRQGTGRDFDFSFVWFKPFVKVFSHAVSGFDPWVNATLQSPRGKPYGDLLTLALSEGRVRSWQRVAADLAFEHAGKIEIAYRTLWNALGESLKDKPAGRKTNEYCKQENLLELSDNQITKFEMPMLDSLLLKAGFREADHYHLLPTVLGTYPTYGRMDYIESPTANFVSNKNLDFYVETYINDFFIVIHGPESLAEAIRSHPAVEGFFCNELTTGGWCFDVGKQAGVWKHIDSSDDIAVRATR